MQGLDRFFLEEMYKNFVHTKRSESIVGREC